MEFLTDESFPLAVPTEVALCPYCHTEPTQLQIMGVECYTRNDDEGLWIADGLDLQCPNEDWKDENCHTYMPYVNWLPVHTTVIDWMNKRYRFDLDREQRERSLKACDFLIWKE